VFKLPDKVKNGQVKRSLNGNKFAQSGHTAKWPKLQKSVAIFTPK
jgi:hypothetical protein